MGNLKRFLTGGLAAAFAVVGAAAYAAPAGTILNEGFSAASTQTFTVVGASDQAVTGLTNWSYRQLSGESGDGGVIDESGNKRVTRSDVSGAASAVVDTNSLTVFRANVPSVTVAVGQSIVIQVRYHINAIAANFGSNTNVRVSFGDQPHFGANENAYTIEGLNGPQTGGPFNDMDFIVWNQTQAAEAAVFEAPNGNANDPGIRAANDTFVIRATFTKTNGTNTAIAWTFLELPTLFADGSNTLAAVIPDGTVLDTAAIMFGGNFTGWADDLVIAEGAVTSVPDWKNFQGFLMNPTRKHELASYAPTQAPWTSPIRLFRTLVDDRK